MSRPHLCSLSSASRRRWCLLTGLLGAVPRAEMVSFETLTQQGCGRAAGGGERSRGPGRCALFPEDPGCTLRPGTAACVCVGEQGGGLGAGYGRASDAVLRRTAEQRLLHGRCGEMGGAARGGGALTGGWAKRSHSLGRRSEPGGCGGWRDPGTGLGSVHRHVTQLSASSERRPTDPRGFCPAGTFQSGEEEQS